MKVKNRAISLVLTLALLLSCITTGTFAADGNIEFNISFEKYDQETHKIVAGAIDQVKNGDVVVVSFMLKNNYSANRSIGSYDAQMKFDKNIFSGFVDSADKEWDGPFYDSYAADTSGSAFTVNVVDGIASIHGANAGGVVVKTGKTVTIGKIALKVADKAEKIATNFTFDLRGKNLVADKTEGVLTVDATTVSAITIDGITPELSTVKLDNKDDATVTVNGTDGATVNATATSAQGTVLTNMVTWSVTDKPAGAGENDVKIAADGTITVVAKAKAGDYTITATGDGTTVTGSASAMLTVERATPVYTVTVTSANLQLTVPTGTETSSSQFFAAVKDQYDEQKTDATVTWSVEPANAGVSVNENGLVTVSADAKEYVTGDESKEFKIRATSSDADQPGEKILTVTREKAVLSAFGLPLNSAEAVNCNVPTLGSAAIENEICAYALDQYEDAFELPNDAVIVWSIPELEGITIAKGTISENEVSTTVTVTTDAVKNDFTNGENGLELNFNATVSYMKDGRAVVSKEVPCVIRRNESTATSVEISGGKSEFTIPVDETVDEATFTAVVKDQYGQPVTGDNATVTWSITPSVTGVNFDNGAVRVTKDAKDDITSFREFTVIAKCGEAEATKNFTVKRAASVVTAIEYTGNTNVVVPDGDGTDAGTITLTFKDQYGTEMTSGVDSSKLQWTCPEGITVETGSGTYSVKVSKGALEHFGNERKDSVEVKITAKYDNLTKEIPVTLKLADVVVTTVQLNGDNSIMIPKTVGSVNTKTYTVTVFDQYNFELPDKAKDATYTFDSSNELVTLDQTNGVATLTVKYGADAVDDKLKATVNGVESEEKTISVTNKSENTTTLKVEQNNVVFGSEIKPTVTGKPENSTDLVYSYEGVDGTTYVSSTAAPTNVGKYKVTVTCETADTFYTKTINFEITAKSIAGMTVTLDHDSLTYNGQNQSVTATIDNLTSNDYTVSGGTTGQNAGTYTVTVTGKGNYTGTVTKTWTITPAELTIKNVALENRAYNGQKNVTVESVTFAGLQNGESLADYTATGMMDDANAGENKDVIVTVTLENTVKNYTLKNRVFESGKVTIAKASHEKVAANMEAKYGNTATLNLATLTLPAGCSFGEISTTDADSIFDGTPSIANSTLSVKLAADKAKVDKKGTITIPVSSTNYQNFKLIVTVTVLNKTAQTLSADAIDTVYGESFTPNVSGAKTELTYKVKSGSIEYKNGKFTATGAGEATIVVTAAETEEYAPAVREIPVNIAKRTLTVKAADKSAYIGEKLPELTYQVAGLVTGDELTVKPVLEVKHAANVDPMKQAGTYVIGFETEPAASANYELSAQTGTLTVSARPSYVGPTGNAVSVDRTENGKISVSPSYAAKGATVTITVTPDKGQELKSLEVIDQNGNSLPLTDLGNGKFSFVMPEGKVTIKSEFGEANAFVNPYDDVKPGDWYYSAVEYVTVNGLMNGTGKGFEPNLATSRAMIWTILARMSDVNTASSGEWYAVAQQWAIANGVSDGTMPNGTITREQLAAMLYRYAVSKGMVKGPATADLSVFADANSVSSYAVEAMQWAVSTGLIGGMDGKLNPQGSATRAQVATMLMRFAELAK